MAPPRPRVWPVFLTFALILPIAGVLTAIALIAVIGLEHILEGDAVGMLTLPALLVAIGVTEVVLLGAVLVAARPLTRARLRLQRGRASLGVLVAATLGAVTLSQVLDTIAVVAGFGRTGVLPMLSGTLERAHGGGLVTALLVVALLAGLAEELFFRGFMQTRLARRWSSRTAVLVTAVCFGAIHMDPVQSPLAFCLGIWLGFVCERAGSLWPGIAAHVANNAVATLFASVGIPLVVTAATALVFVACLLWLRRALPPAPPEAPAGPSIPPVAAAPV